MNTSEEPIISVIMPVYNSDKTLSSAIESVLKQSLHNWELIIVDDGSTDQSPSIARSFQDPRIKVITFAKNQGTAKAQNAGFSLARAEYIALHDSDDLWRSDKLELQLSALRQLPNVDVTFSFSQMIGPGGKELRARQLYSTPKITAKEMLLHYPIGNGSNALFRRKVLDKSRPSPTGAVDASIRASHDVEMWVRWAASTHCVFHCVPEILTYYRVSSESYSAQLLAKHEDYLKMLDKISLYEPQLIIDYGTQAKAFHGRYLARRAFAQAEASIGIFFIVGAIRQAPLALLRHEFGKTLSALFGNLVLALIPAFVRRKFVAALTEKSSHVIRT